MSKLESSLEKTFNREAAKRGLLSIKLIAQSRRGFPDRTVIGKNKLIFFVELKREGEDPKPHQGWWHRLLKKLGFNVYVCDNKEQAIEIFEKEMEGARLSKNVRKKRI